MSEFNKPAVEIQQSGKVLYATSFTVSDLKTPDFYRIEKLDPDQRSSDAFGYQRILQEARSNRLAKYIQDSWEHEEGHKAFLPTSIFLATQHSLNFDQSKKELQFDSNVLPFNVVDGQHRIKGIIKATEKNSELEDFQLTTIIAVNLSPAEQMLQFYIVNTTQKPVDESVAQQIRARLYKMKGIHDLPYIPSWIDRAVSMGTDDRGISMAQFLNSEPSSPWYKRIQMANSPRPQRHSITQKTFVATLKKSRMLYDSHPLADISEPKRNEVFKNYWSAVEKTFTGGEENTVVFKSVGMSFFCIIFERILTTAHIAKDYRTDTFRDIFNEFKEWLLDNPLADNSALEIFNPDWWKSGNESSGMNVTAIQKKATDFNKAISKYREKDGIKL